MDIPEPILKNLRKCLKLKEDDTSRDEEIKSRDSMENLELIFSWNIGDARWAHIAKTWFEGLNIKLDYKRSKKK